MMTTMNEHGLGLLLAMMIAHGAANEAPAEKANDVAAPRPVLVAAGEADTFGAPSSGIVPDRKIEAAESTFRRLPVEDQRTARALLEAEQVGAESNAATPWSLGKIASERASGKDWETIVTEMQTRSLIAAGELADVLSPRNFASRLGKSEDLSAGLAVANGPPVGTPQTKKLKASQAAAEKFVLKARPKATEIAANPGATGCNAASAATEAELNADGLAETK